LASYLWVVLTNAVDGMDADLNAWYDDVHLPDLLSVDGVVTARRFRLVPEGSQGEYRYLCLYEIETDNLEALRTQIVEAAKAGEIAISDSLAEGTWHTFFEPMGAELSRGGAMSPAVGV
jgi:hypothetical protein